MVKPPLAHNILSFMMRVTWKDHQAFSIERSASVPRDKVALTILLHSRDYHHAHATRAFAKATMRVSSSARKRWACMHLNSSDIRRPEDRTGRHGYKVRQPRANVAVAHLRTKGDSSIALVGCGSLRISSKKALFGALKIEFSGQPTR